VSAMPASLARVAAKGDVAHALAVYAEAMHVPVLCIMTNFAGPHGFVFTRELAVYSADPKRLQGSHNPRLYEPCSRLRCSCGGPAARVRYSKTHH